MLIRSVSSPTLRTGIAVTALALLPVFSWQALDGRSSATVAAPAAVMAARAETIIRKSMITWGHTKSDRLAVRGTARPLGRPVTVETRSEKADREAMSMVTPAVAAEEFADWLVPGKTGTARIIDFAVRRSSDDRKTCRSQHNAIVKAFAIRKARVMADQPVMFQSSICTTNGEIVITCFGTSATVSPRKVRPGGRCTRPG